MSSPDDDASKLSRTLDEILNSPQASDWSIDDPVDEPAAPAAREQTADVPVVEHAASQQPQSNEDVLDVHDIDVPDAVEPIGERTYVLPEIVPATSDTSADAGVDGDADGDVAGATEGTEAAGTVEPISLQPGVQPVTPATIPVDPSPDRSPMQPSVAPSQPAVAAAPMAAPEARPVGWHEHVATPAAPNRTPGRKPRVRRVTRVLRHIDPWSTFKLALLFSLVAYVSALTSGVLLWRVAETTGALDNVERWFTQFGWETFEFKGGEIFRNAWIIGLFGVVFATGGAVLLVTLFNLVSDIIGGVRVTVLEEEVVERTVTSTRRYVVRRPGTAADASTADGAWSLDDDVPDTVAPATAATPAATPTAAPPPAGDWSIDDEPASGAPAG